MATNKKTYQYNVVNTEKFTLVLTGFVIFFERPSSVFSDRMVTIVIKVLCHLLITR